MKTDDAIAEYVKTASAMSMLVSLGAKNIVSGSGEWIRHSCIIDLYDKHHSNGDSSPSAAIHESSKAYSCFVYGTLSAKRFLDLVFSGDKMRAISFLQDTKGENKSFSEQLAAKMASKRKLSMPVKSESVIDAYSDDVSYFESRGVSREVCERHKLRLDSAASKAVIPLRDVNGKLIAFQFRSVNGSLPKYENSKGLDKSQVIFASSGAMESDEIVVVESVFSTLVLETYGYESMSILGSKVYDEHVSFMLKYRKVKLWLDDDIAGVSCALRLAKRIKGPEVSVVLSDIRGKDPADMTKLAVDRNMSKQMNLIEGTRVLKKAIEYLGSHK